MRTYVNQTIKCLLATDVDAAAAAAAAATAAAADDDDDDDDDDDGPGTTNEYMRCDSTMGFSDVVL